MNYFNSSFEYTRKYFLITTKILFVVSFFHCAEAQNNQIQLFENGKQSFLNNEYYQAYQLFSEVSEILGEPKMRLQPWLVRSAYQSRRYHEAERNLQEYLSLNPDPDLIEYQEMQDLQKQIKDAIEKSKIEYDRVIAIESTDQFITELKVYADKFRDGQYRESLIRKLKDVDQEAFEKVNPNDLRSIDNYLQRFNFYFYEDLSQPGQYYMWRPSNQIEANQYKTAYHYNRALQENTLQAYNDYLHLYPNYRKPANERRIMLLKDDLLFSLAMREGTEEAYWEYLQDNNNLVENRNYEIIESEVDKIEKQEEVAYIEMMIDRYEGNLTNYRRRATSNYAKGIVGLAVASTAGYFLYDIYDRSENKGIELSDRDSYVGAGSGLVLVLSAIYVRGWLKDGVNNTNSIKSTKQYIRELEKDVRQLSLSPSIDPFSNSYHLALRINF